MGKKSLEKFRIYIKLDLRRGCVLGSLFLSLPARFEALMQLYITMHPFFGVTTLGHSTNLQCSKGIEMEL